MSTGLCLYIGEDALRGDVRSEGLAGKLHRGRSGTTGQSLNSTGHSGLNRQINLHLVLDGRRGLGHDLLVLERNLCRVIALGDINGKAVGIDLSGSIRGNHHVNGNRRVRAVNLGGIGGSRGRGAAGGKSGNSQGHGENASHSAGENTILQGLHGVFLLMISVGLSFIADRQVTRTHGNPWCA